MFTIRKDICTPMFIAAQFTIAKIGNSLSAHQQMSGLKSCGTSTQWNTMLLQKGSPTIHNSMDGAEEHYAK